MRGRPPRHGGDHGGQAAGAEGEERHDQGTVAVEGREVQRHEGDAQRKGQERAQPDPGDRGAVVGVELADAFIHMVDFRTGDFGIA